MSEAFNPVDGTRIAYQEVGTGTPLVLVHGSALSRAIWRGFGYVKALRNDYRLILLDMRGHGLSGKPHGPADYAMTLVLQDLLAVYDVAGIDAAHFMGYSFGARVGFSLADAHPERMLSLISAGGTYRLGKGTVSSLFFPGYDEALESGGMRAFLDGWEAEAGVAIDPATTNAFLANDPVALQAYFRQLAVEQGVDEKRLASIQTPALLLAGTDDRQRYIDSERAAGLMPHARFEPLPGRGHGDTLFPAGPVLELVQPFLAGIDAMRSV
ncbi:alpha/beta hydrolase [Subtercola boreus]|uniref:Alpha/beta hydrolase n=1 Tax=Subtercola boreus TaxID=120213 RepID=A0A3E0W4P2_9MICO|nr:alpha/beta hydrolase [Subtercola boreus]RFA17222.1 alpha/beta hydrolase [Subtercola boreus]